MKPTDCKKDCNGPDCEGCQDFEPVEMKPTKAEFIEEYGERYATSYCMKMESDLDKLLDHEKREAAIEFANHIRINLYGGWGDDGETEFTYDEWIKTTQK